MTDALAAAAEVGMAARTVDVVAHSMGGLATRYLLSTAGPLSPVLLPNPVHKLITIGTPHQGSPLATTLWDDQNLTTILTVFAAPEVRAWCLAFSSCTLGDLMGVLGKPVAGAVQSLEPNSKSLQALSSTNVFSAIVGSSPTPLSVTEVMLDLLINAFLPLQTVGTILNGQTNDTIVPTSSQDPSGAADTASITGIVHTSLCGPCNTGETASSGVWNQAYYWLTGGTGAMPTSSTPETLVSAVGRPRPAASVSPAPVLNLSGYTEVAASNVTITPATGSTLTINGATGITAASPTKTITEVLLLQTVADPADTALLYATLSPFAISFTPTRLGSANFAAVTVFGDNTYAVTPLSYSFQPSGRPYALNLVNAPVANMTVGSSRVVEAYALFTSGPINVTSAATYSSGSGSSSVFSVSAGGVITATGNGMDLLDVSYGGLTATAQVPVGVCTYSLNPTNQIVPYTGGTVTIQVTTQAGCAWTATGGAGWLSLMQASGTGSGSITLTSAANSSGGTQGAIVYLAGLQAVVTQPATACSYSPSQTQISAPAAGASGSIGAGATCPVITSSNQSWLAAMPLGSSVAYTIAPNNGASQRSATLTIGTINVPVTQAGNSALACAVSGDGMAGIVDVQRMINQALGSISAANDLNGDGVVSVVDVQIVIDAALGFPCAAQ